MFVVQLYLLLVIVIIIIAFFFFVIVFVLHFLSSSFYKLNCHETTVQQQIELSSLYIEISDFLSSYTYHCFQCCCRLTQYNDATMYHPFHIINYQGATKAIAILHYHFLFVLTTRIVLAYYRNIISGMQSINQFPVLLLN